MVHAEIATVETSSTCCSNNTSKSTGEWLEYVSVPMQTWFVHDYMYSLLNCVGSFFTKLKEIKVKYQMS
jgi:hypothetical protein